MKALMLRALHVHHCCALVHVSLIQAERCSARNKEIDQIYRPSASTEDNSQIRQKTRYYNIPLWQYSFDSLSRICRTYSNCFAKVVYSEADIILFHRVILDLIVILDVNNGASQTRSHQVRINIVYSSHMPSFGHTHNTIH